MIALATHLPGGRRAHRRHGSGAPASASARVLWRDQNGRVPKRKRSGMMPDVNRIPDWFAERSVKGMLTRMVGAWLLVGLPVIAARIWWSPAGAIAVFVVTLTAYVTFAVRYMRGHRREA